MPIYVRAEGFKELQRKLKGQPIYAGPWKAALTAATRLVWESARRRAPRGEGALRASLTQAMDAAEVPTWGRVSTDDRPKAWVLEAGRRRRRGEGIIQGRAKAGEPTVALHYGSTARKGQSTAKWLRFSLTKNRGRILRLLAEAAKQIEAAWGRSV